MESSFYQVYKNQGDGFIVLQLIAENYNHQTPSVADLAAWVTEHSVTFPVLADPNWQVCDPLLTFGALPSYVLVDQDLIIQKKGLLLGFFHNKIKNLLGISD